MESGAEMRNCPICTVGCSEQVYGCSQQGFLFGNELEVLVISAFRTPETSLTTKKKDLSRDFSGCCNTRLARPRRPPILRVRNKTFCVRKRLLSLALRAAVPLCSVVVIPFSCSRFVSLSSKIKKFWTSRHVTFRRILSLW